MTHLKSLVALLALIALTTAGCSRQTPLAPTQGPSRSAHGPAPGSSAYPGGAMHVEGEIGPGALYAMDVPADWNGDLVLYAHGYTTPQEPVALPVGLYPVIRDALLARHFAVAATSFSANGFAEAEGVRQVHQLRGLFAARAAMPARVFLVGVSLGGLIDADLLRSFPEQYAGALSVSGPLGGTRAEFQYVGDVRALWDLLMPCRLPGTFSQVPSTPLPINDIASCIQQNQQTFGVLVSVHRQGGMRVAGVNGTELATSVASTLGFHWYGMADGIDRAHGHMPYDNHDAVYVSDVGVPAPVLQTINAAIMRYTTPPDAANYLSQHYLPDGVLQRPLLALHATRDRLVPVEHEQLLLDRVTAAGCLDQLAQWKCSRYGHSEAFTAADVATAFDALVGWVGTGVKPANPLPDAL